MCRIQHMSATRQWRYSTYKQLACKCYEQCQSCSQSEAMLRLGPSNADSPTNHVKLHASSKARCMHQQTHGCTAWLMKIKLPINVLRHWTRSKAASQARHCLLLHAKPRRSAAVQNRQICTAESDGQSQHLARPQASRLRCCCMSLQYHRLRYSTRHCTNCHSILGNAGQTSRMVNLACQACGADVLACQAYAQFGRRLALLARKLLQRF